LFDDFSYGAQARITKAEAAAIEKDPKKAGTKGEADDDDDKR
jgi:hypothetical protein